MASILGWQSAGTVISSYFVSKAFATLPSQSGSHIPACMKNPAVFGCSGSGCSEDCLFVNIWTPYLPLNGRAPQTKLKAVMCWIHGDAFAGGTGADPTFDSGNLKSSGDVVMVAINYRLSTLGFLALNDGKTNENYGLDDIITAFDWVRTHITDFGGDPNRITIFRHSDLLGLELSWSAIWIT